MNASYISIANYEYKFGYFKLLYTSGCRDEVFILRNKLIFCQLAEG